MLIRTPRLHRSPWAASQTLQSVVVVECVHVGVYARIGLLRTHEGALPCNEVPPAPAREMQTDSPRVAGCAQATLDTPRYPSMVSPTATGIAENNQSPLYWRALRPKQKAGRQPSSKTQPGRGIARCVHKSNPSPI